jgi:hypothetical protein
MATIRRESGTYGWVMTDVTQTSCTEDPVTISIPQSRSYLLSIGESTKDFRRRQRKGELIPMKMWHQLSIRGEISGSYSAGAIDGSWCDNVLSYPPYGWPAVNLSNEELEELLPRGIGADLVQAAAARIYSRGWDSLTFIAELDKTVAMFRNLVKRVITLVAKGRFFDLWLEGRYGWRTLIYDMQDIEKAISNLDDKKTRFKAAPHETYEEETNEESLVSSYYGMGEVVLSTTKHLRVSVRGTVVADLIPPNMSFNPVVTAWEVVPYSFVIDWILNIGRWIEALSFLAITSNYTACEGYEVRVNMTHTSTSQNPTAGHYFNWQGVAQCEYVLTKRVPTSVSTRPRFTLNLDRWKIVDLIGLLVQLIQRGK